MKKIKHRNPRIIISRTDNIGDVILALPVAGAIKKAIPGAYVIFLGKSYTEDIIAMSECVDKFVNWDVIKKQTKHAQIRTFERLKADYILHVFPERRIAKIAKKARIPRRVGTTGRLFHWNTCNKLVAFSRRRSGLHEAQLNMKLLKPLGIHQHFSLAEISALYQLTPPNILPEKYRDLLSNEKFNLILHPKSKGSAREWGLKNYAELITRLPREKFNIFITGTQEDAQDIEMDRIRKFPEVIDLCGKLSLVEFISFIANADGLVACSTGPLHIAAAVNKFAIGIYPPIKPMHPGRWAPLGINAHYFVSDKKCNACRNSLSCECIEQIKPQQIYDYLMSLFASSKELLISE